MFAVFAFKIKVSIILKIIQWNYQLKNQNWAVYELGTVLLFKRFWLKNLPLPVLSRNGPLAMKFAFCVFLSFYGFCGFYSRSSECASRFKLFSSLESFKTKCEYFKMTFFVRSSSLCMLYFWRKRHDLPWLTTTHFKTYKKSLYTLLFFCLAWSEKDSWRVAEIPNFTQIEDGVRNKRA